MILTDAGPLAALINQRDPDHALCVSTAGNLPSPMATTWAAFDEAMYLLGRDVGWKGQQPLLSMVQAGALRLIHVEDEWIPGIIAAMERYRDRPMDLADATLIAVAEARGFTRIFSIDSDFHIYRLAGGKTLEVVP